MPLNRPKGRFGFYGERSGDKEPKAVRREFRALLDDPDKAVGLDAAAIIPRLDAIGEGRIPPDTINATSYAPELFWWVEGNAAVLYTVVRNSRGRVVQAIALRFCRSASAHVHMSDVAAARRRLLELRNA